MVMHDKEITVLPFTMFKPHEKQAQSNHWQSREQLAKRGGLSLLRLWRVDTTPAMHTQPLRDQHVELRLEASRAGWRSQQRRFDWGRRAFS